GDRPWYGSAFVAEFRRPARLDDSIYSARMIGDACADGVFLCRAWGDPAFSEEDREILRLFHLEIARQFPLRSEAPKASLPPPPDGRWSPRESETLALLLTGASEKRIAADLGLSPHTVHDYVKVIYRRLGVASRAEMMARALVPRPSHERTTSR